MVLAVAGSSWYNPDGYRLLEQDESEKDTSIRQAGPVALYKRGAINDAAWCGD